LCVVVEPFVRHWIGLWCPKSAGRLSAGDSFYGLALGETMNRIAAILEKASELNRRLYSSLPLGYKMAQLVLKYAEEDSKAFGVFVFSLFIQAGVKGLPDIGGRPALEYQDLLKKVGVDRFKRVEPKAYADLVRESNLFARQTYALFLRRHSANLLEDAIGETIAKLAANPNLIKPVQLPQAIVFVRRLIETSIIDYVRVMKRHRVETLQPDVSESGAEVEHMDPGSFHGLEDLDEVTMQGIMRDLGRVHKIGPAWLEAKLEGRTNVELARILGMHEVYVGSLLKKFEPAFKKVILKHLDREELREVVARSLCS
jgi:hypothetical protein